MRNGSLAAWFHWNDRRSLIHAIWVCEKHPVNFKKIKKWAAKEGEPEKLEQFIIEYKKLVGASLSKPAKLYWVRADSLPSD